MKYLLVIPLLSASINLIASDDSKAASAPESPRLALAKMAADSSKDFFKEDAEKQIEDVALEVNLVYQPNTKDHLNRLLDEARLDLASKLKPENLTQSYHETFTSEELELINKIRALNLIDKLNRHHFNYFRSLTTSLATVETGVAIARQEEERELFEETNES